MNTTQYEVTIGSHTTIVLAGDTPDHTLWTQIDPLVKEHGPGIPQIKRIGPAPADAAPAPVVDAPAAPVDVDPLPAPVDPTPTPAPVVEAEYSASGDARALADRRAAEAAGFAMAQPIYRRGTTVNSIGVENARAKRAEYDAMPLVTTACQGLAETVWNENRRDVKVIPADLRAHISGALAIVRDPSVRPEMLAMERQALISMMSRLGMGAGAEYLARIPADLRALNLDRLLDLAASGRLAGVLPSDPWTLRTRRDGESEDGRSVYAVVTERYQAYDVDSISEAIATAVRAECPDARGMVTYDGVKAEWSVLFHSTVKPADYVAGEVFRAGVIVRSQDDGGSSIRGGGVVWQNLCRNLIIIDRSEKETIRIRHTGDVTSTARKFRAGFKQALESVDHFRKAWSVATHDDLASRAKALSTEALPDDGRELLRGIFTSLLLGDAQRDPLPVRGRKADALPALVTAWERDTSFSRERVTRTAVANAITRYAHETNPDPWAEYDLQRAAGQFVYDRRPVAWTDPETL